LSRATGRLDFAQPANVLARRIRGLNPWPGCRVKLCDAAGTELTGLRLVRARAIRQRRATLGTGEIMIDGTIQTGTAALRFSNCSRMAVAR